MLDDNQHERGHGSKFYGFQFRDLHAKLVTGIAKVAMHILYHTLL